MYQSKKLYVALAAVFIGMIQPVCAETTNDSPVGYWKTTDDITGQPKSIIQVWQTPDKVLMGKVIKVFPRAGHEQTKLCTACLGDKHNQVLVGMEIISGIKANHSIWDQGEILNTDNGKTYSCSMRLSDSGKKLSVNGYTGLPLFGKTQTWERVDLMSGLSSRGYFYD